MNEWGPFDPVDSNLFSKRARSIIKDINSRNKVAIVEGGSAQYINFLFDGNVDSLPDTEFLDECRQAA